MEEMELIHKVENGELDMLGYVMLNPELKEPFSDYARGNGITCPTAADAVRFLKEYEERLYQELLHERKVLERYAELMIDKIRQMSAGEWQKPWFTPRTGLPQNISGVRTTA